MFLACATPSRPARDSGRKPRQGRVYLVRMVPLAVSGPVVIGIAVLAAVLLAWVLLRAETRDDAREEADGESKR
jgi:hypothetical protein